MRATNDPNVALWRITRPMLTVAHDVIQPAPELARKVEMNDGKKGVSLRDISMFERANGGRTPDSAVLRFSVEEAQKRSAFTDVIMSIPVLGHAIWLVGAVARGIGDYFTRQSPPPSDLFP